MDDWETDLNRILNLLFYDFFAVNYLAKITPIPLTQNQFSILKILKISGPLLVSAIAEILHISRAAASKNIDNLVKLKLVRRKIETRDRRKASVSLLNSGERIVIEFEALCLKQQKIALAALTKKEQQQMSELLGKYFHQRLAQEEELDLICPICNGSISNECILLNHDVKCLFHSG